MKSMKKYQQKLAQQTAKNPGRQNREARKERSASERGCPIPPAKTMRSRKDKLTSRQALKKETRTLVRDAF